MKYVITSEKLYIPKYKTEHRLNVGTTEDISQILLKIAKDNSMTLSQLVNNAILHFLVDYVEQDKTAPDHK